MKRNEFDRLSIGDKVYPNKGRDKGKACTVIGTWPFGDIVVEVDDGVSFEEDKWKGKSRRHGSYRHFGVGEVDAAKEVHLVVCYDHRHELITADAFWDFTKALTCFDEGYPSPENEEDGVMERNTVGDGDYSYAKSVNEMDVFVRTVRVR